MGTGWNFPPLFDETYQTMVMVSDEEDIAQSLYIILSTMPGERVMRPDFGCNLQGLIFETLDKRTQRIIVDRISMAILNFEPRVTLDEVKVKMDKSIEGLVEVNLHYTIMKTNVRTNIVYPFYINEGTNLGDDVT